MLSAVGATDYLYDSKGKRIWKGIFTGGTITGQELSFYGVDGQKLGTYSLNLNYGTGQPLYLSCTNTSLAVFFGGKRVAVNGVAFVQDRLASQGKYFPYGEDQGTPLANDQVKFATYTRDSATGLDYADQRYYSNQFGRFMSPDPYQGSGEPNDPASWNRYSYVIGDPINLFDPFGTTYCFVDPNTNQTISCYDRTDVTATFDPVKYYFFGGGSAASEDYGGRRMPWDEVGKKQYLADLKEAKTSSEDECRNSFSNSSLGEAVQFFSMINAITNFPNVWPEWTVFPGAKALAVAVLQSVSKTVGSTDFLSVAGSSVSTTILGEFANLIGAVEAASGPGLLAIPIATAVDAGVRQMCSQVPGLRFGK